MATDYHAKLFGYELSRRYPSDSVERYAFALMDSLVDLNPHQVDAALFAFRSPLSKGAILADEVGLGKTIEAGIALSQKWAERKRKILIIVPSSLRKQWFIELQDKFYLPSDILETGSFNNAIREGRENPFVSSSIVICSYYFARNKSEYVRAINWDLVVIDEAHRLRNVYKSGNKIARELKQALDHVPKILLTATPLQNTLLELYGLVSFIDEHTFGDLKSFRGKFARLTGDENYDDLKARLAPICKRTLRKQVLEYIRYTERKAYTQEFIPSEQEQVLYDLVSDYLRRPNLQALPASQRTLMTLVLRKLLASSTFAIAGALHSLKSKLEVMLKENQPNIPDDGELGKDFEAYEEIAEETEEETVEERESLTPEDITAIKNEILVLSHFCELATKIANNAKGQALLQALGVGFRMTAELGGQEKAIIFTESRRTQKYLLELLKNNGYSGQIVLFNGSNSDDISKSIYSNWKSKYQGSDRVSGSRTADSRSALVDYFKDSAKIMIATEAAAEGINLQFCSLVVNYDLPWNPQRIEQRIGRCHRYGQKHDVVVVNFLNRKNEADQFVFQLLSDKFQLFSGVFGASDEVLGSIESGINFEKRIAEIYQTCRTQEEIQASFDSLQAELSENISENMRSTRQKLLENFDSEVSEKLNVYKAEAQKSINKLEAMLWDITHQYFDGKANFDEPTLSFHLKSPLAPEIPAGKYTLKKGMELGHHYRIQHPLAQRIINEAKAKELPQTELVFEYTGSGKKISILEPFVGQAGVLKAYRLTVCSFEDEDHILICAVTDKGQPLDMEQARRLFSLPAKVIGGIIIDDNPLNITYERLKGDTLGVVSERNAVFFDEEMGKLDKWADDRRKTLKESLKEYDDQIKEAKKKAKEAPNLPEKLEVQKEIRNLERKRDEAWKEYDSAALNVVRQKDELIDKIESRLKQRLEEQTLFTIRWKLI